MDLAVIIVCIKEGDFLRQTLTRSRRALPDAKFCIVHLNEDAETKAICEALRVYTTVSLPESILTLNDAQFNIAPFVKTAQIRMKEMLKIPTWTIITRPQIILDANLALLDYSKLDTNNVYGCFLDSIQNHTELLRFQANEPSAAQVREQTPCREFLLVHQPKDFPNWSKSAYEATEEFLGQFTFQYMLQLKLGHLGTINEDKEGRVTARWEERHRVPAPPPVKIAPVHAGATQQKEQEKKSAQKEIQKVVEEQKPKQEKSSKLSKMFLSSDLSDSSTMSTARKEVDEQNIFKQEEPKSMSQENKLESKKKSNPFKVPLDKV
jgi:hypothetical protein